MAARPSIYKHVARRLAVIRKDKGWRQEDLVDGTTMGDSMVSKLETGARNLQLHRLAELAAALDVNVTEFLVGYDARPRAKGAREPVGAYGASDDRTRLTELVVKLGPRDVHALLGIAERLAAATERGK